MIETVRLIEAGKAPRTPQNDLDATYAPMNRKEDALIDFTKSAHMVGCLIRGMVPWPVAYAVVNGEAMKVFSQGLSRAKEGLAAFFARIRRTGLSWPAGKAPSNL